ncbi:hypothetical protein SDC9_205182 [bioreactor metagenome]|uniref:Uncharacterized protein n=1 Tax=bioreactor metagenome TaxID=1076179 RepID=A0A645J1D2_9ZZZZ
MHAVNPAHARLKALHGVHHLPVKAAFVEVGGFDEDGQHVHAYGIAADDGVVVAVVA